MVSRTSPPHQLISAPVTDITPLVICAFADTASASDIPSAKGHPVGCIGDSSIGFASEFISLLPEIDSQSADSI
jgi:hypothetical protein